MANWVTDLIQKLNPAQPSIASLESTVTPDNIYDYQTAYQEIEIVRRAIEIVISAFVEVPFTAEGGAEKKIHKLLNERPNPFEDRVRFFRRAVLDYFIDGNVFIYYDNKAASDRITNGEPDGTSLYLIPANDTEIIPDTKTFVRAYEYVPLTGDNDPFFGYLGKPKEKTDSIIFEPHEIIHIKNDSFDSIYRGDSKLKSMNRLIELYNAMINFQRQFFENNAIPGLVLQTDNVLSQKVKERLLDSWRASYTTIFKGARSPAILDGGLKIDSFSTVKFTELDFENSIERIQQDMAKALGVPYVLLKSGNNANISQNQVLLYTHTVLPILDQFASAFSLRFAGTKVGVDRLSVPALRPDTRSQATFYSTLVNGGIITPNEARDGLRFLELDDKECDEIRVPQNIAGSATNPAIGGRPESDEGDSS